MCAEVRVDPVCMQPRILIADDNAIFRKALRQLLERADHWEVVEAQTGDEAVTKSVETRPNVVILDLAMPDKDGLAAAREISTLLPATPILMCTMQMSTLVQTEALKSGIRKVLSKTDSSLLVMAVRQLLSPEAASDQSPEQSPVPEPIPLPVVASTPLLAAPLSDTAPTDAASDAVPPSSSKNIA